MWRFIHTLARAYGDCVRESLQRETQPIHVAGKLNVAPACGTVFNAAGGAVHRDTHTRLSLAHRGRASLILAIIVIAGGSTLPSARAWLTHVIEQARPVDDYLAPPGFSLQAFRGIKPGMTEDEVRARLGLPLQRYWNGSKCYWFYTVPSKAGACRYTCCQVIFDPASGRVLYIRSDKRDQSTLSDNPWIALLGNESLTLRLAADNGTEHVLSPEHPKPVLLFVCREASRASKLRETLTTLSRQETVDIDDQLDIITVGVDATARDAYASCEPPLYTTPQSLVMLYRQGRIYPVPSAPPPNIKDNGSQTADWRWLLRNLIQPKTPHVA